VNGSTVRLVVSVQALGFEDKPREGHLATGLLAEPGVVLAPDGFAEATEVVAERRRPEFEDPDDGILPGDPCDLLLPCRKGPA
jgi:hypothetical protein